MLKHLQSRRGDRSLLERGFTLVELLVVIVILGILAAVVVFAVGGTEKDANVKACLTERSTVEAAVEAYKSAQQDDPALGPISIGAMQPDFLRRAPQYWTLNGEALQRQAHGGLAAGDPKCQP